MSGPAIAGRSFAAAQSFILEAKMHWTRTLFPALRDEYQARARQARKKPRSTAEVARLVEGTTLYRYYAWLERHLQRMKYSGRYGLMPYHEQGRSGLEAELAAAALPTGMLELDPECAVPDYYAEIDIHQHPGGVYGDAIAGFIYERGARTTTPLLGGKHRDLHDRLVSFVGENGGAPRRLLDLGCGFGKSTAPFYGAFRDTEVVGVDIAAPLLRLAAREAARAQARNVQFKQRRAEDTRLPDASFDLVTSTMLLHEMAPRAIAATFAECRRVLSPGGRMVHLDFHLVPDPFLRFIHEGHARRNNEPHMAAWARIDVKTLLRKHGFKKIREMPFAEGEGVLDGGFRSWRFPWTLIAAERA
jgi:ubiquinone/menaquinone biosynthesis C-methylase UbiE